MEKKVLEISGKSLIVAFRLIDYLFFLPEYVVNRFNETFSPLKITRFYVLLSQNKDLNMYQMQ